MHGSNAGAAEPPAPFAGLALAPMRAEDLDQVLEIERHSFSSPWNRDHFLFELRDNPCAVNWVARCGEAVLGYACAWRLGTEFKLNNVAVRPDRRRRGLARWILHHTLLAAAVGGCRIAQLEVRPSNAAALRLYRAFGFVVVGRRKGYYQREREDALLMEAELARRCP